jgi:hypothetical protein
MNNFEDWELWVLLEISGEGFKASFSSLPPTALEIGPPTT